MNPVLMQCWASGPLVARIVAAVLGGYVLAALTSVAALALPLAAAEAALGGMLSGFLVHAAAVVWVFAVRSATRAWLGLLAAASPLALLSWWVWRQAGGAA